ncbi:MAG TPA: hypothetical protein VHK63_05670, partial [Candidatus Limnocylindria bacterium]|nr:hypothetical protein [Candidatus Limnocylindria bacterium]
PMPPRAAARPRAAWRLPGPLCAFAVGVGLLTGCGTSPSQPPLASGGGVASTPASAAPSLPPTPTPSPTPVPTPQYTNAPDAALRRLIPERIGGVRVVVPPVDEFAYTPGDVGSAYGELGLRFTALQVAYVEEPRLSLYAMRVAPPAVTTRELEPYLETAGQYVGIAGLVREPWKLRTIRGRLAWVRPEDNATALGTTIYTWAAGEYVFLMIGVDDGVNRAVFAALPGEDARRGS